MFRKILNVIHHQVRRVSPFAIFAYRLNDHINNLIPKFYTDLDGRYYRFIYCLHKTMHLKGDVVELGTGTGRGAAYIVSVMSKLGGDRSYHAFDSFQGFPSINEYDLEGVSERRRKKVSVVGHYKDYGYKHISRVVASAQLRNSPIKTKLFPGDVCETVYELPEDQQYSFVFIDLDLYDGYMASLDALYTRVQPGGIILFDEYQFPDEWPGAKRAVDEFMQDKPEELEFFPYDGSAFITKLP